MKYKASVDARDYQPRDKHRVILETFDSLEPGEVMELVNDHEPKPLFYQFQAEMPDQFTWENVELGPQVWRVAIGKK